ncbi:MULTISPECIES: GntR family transcriptional regulator [Thalassobaculum]|uniref:DNA-binding transcriptional regulator, GntR family n=1 Tax=Thalassobaculum litoreum DSM 18839 TaxID=1123362 RepID=A0A8G2BK84_9PROT|nr:MULTISPECIES: GntR family transcriptional regulator [Thalassobaculum]SDG17359.1 DNA-binding transcriptional regulator, GntR family [Thalassobaculum litoreum DSM 18839]
MSSARFPASLATLVTNRLRQEIVEGAFELGQALSEAKIAKRYEVSRTPVREAFARLELEELVHTEPQSGTYVFTIDRHQFEQISEARSILEGAALRLSFDRNHGHLVEHWRALVITMESAAEMGDTRAYSAADGQFHDVLFELTDNPYLETARRPFAARLAAIRNRLGLSPEHVAKSRTEHRDLLAHVEAGNLDAAITLLRYHIVEKGATFWSVPAAKPDQVRRRALQISSR